MAEPKSFRTITSSREVAVLGVQIAVDVLDDGSHLIGTAAEQHLLKSLFGAESMVALGTAPRCDNRALSPTERQFVRACRTALDAAIDGSLAVPVASPKV